VAVPVVVATVVATVAVAVPAVVATVPVAVPVIVVVALTMLPACPRSSVAFGPCRTDPEIPATVSATLAKPSA